MFTSGDLNKAAEKINQLKPDLLIFTGDLIDKPHLFNDHQHALAVLQNLKLPSANFVFTETMTTAATVRTRTRL